MCKTCKKMRKELLTGEINKSVWSEEEVQMCEECNKHYIYSWHGDCDEGCFPVLMKIESDHELVKDLEERGMCFTFPKERENESAY